MKNAIKRIVWEGLYQLRNALDPVFRFQETAILCYHSISDVPFDTNISPADFEAQLKELARRGYVFVSLGDIVAWAAGERVLPRKTVALTFDDGYADFESTVLPLAQQYKAPVALFMVGDIDASRAHLGQDNSLLSPDAVARIKHEALVEVGYHSKTHPNLAKLQDGELAGEITPPSSMQFFAYPGGGHSPAASAAVRAAGYKAAFTIRPVLVKKTMDPYLLPRSVVLKHMSPRSVCMRASRAADWYRALTHLV